ncbi:hypothetical protein RD792_001208 [Penstemon davidsonii]|uniref:Hydroxyproline-rich glycoprotein family protein n=1 Tax=Penstemon davidsonii TaxID=160366 RepID=A0ABR0DNY1_9LAMI|nr:hypothetical protein RD792_001208 [Penstemon davidsonii]
MERSSTPISSHGDESRPSLGFPLGTALLLVVIFSLSGVFSCCYHWDKLRPTFSLHPFDLETADGNLAYPTKPTTSHKKQKNMSMQVIIMPGDNVPKFIAMPCPCERPRQQENKLVIAEALDQKPPAGIIALSMH